MKTAVILLCLASIARADPVSDARSLKRAGAITLGVGLALTIAGAVLLGQTLYNAEHAPPSDSAGPAVNDLGLAVGSAFVLQSGLAMVAAGGAVYRIGAKRSARVAWMPNGFRF